MLLAQQDGTLIVLIAVIVLVLFFLIWLVLVMRYFHLWLQAYMSRTPVSLLEIFGMQLRKVNPRVIIKALIVAKQSDVIIPREELEKAYLQGADIEKLILAMIQANRQNIDITFQELIDADLDDRLAEKLGR